MKVSATGKKEEKNEDPAHGRRRGYRQLQPPAHMGSERGRPKAAPTRAGGGAGESTRLT